MGANGKLRSGSSCCGFWSTLEKIRRPLRSAPLVPARDMYLTMPCWLDLTFVPGRNGWRDAVVDGALELA